MKYRISKRQGNCLKLKNEDFYGIKDNNNNNKDSNKLIICHHNTMSLSKKER